MPAFRRAMADGADSVECDLRLTADRQWVIHHDADIRLKGELLRIADLELSDLHHVVMAAGNDPIPTLVDFLDWCRGESVDPVLDVKDTDGISELIDTVEGAGLAQPPVVSSFRRSVLGDIGQHRPDWPVALIVGDPRFRVVRRMMFGSFLRRAQSLHAVALHLHERWVSPSVIQATHEAGLRMAVWTPDDPLRIALLASLGVDAVITNRPEVARAAFDTSLQ